MNFPRILLYSVIAACIFCITWMFESIISTFGLWPTNNRIFIIVSLSVLAVTIGMIAKSFLGYLEGKNDIENKYSWETRINELEFETQKLKRQIHTRTTADGNIDSHLQLESLKNWAVTDARDEIIQRLKESIRSTEDARTFESAISVTSDRLGLHTKYLVRRGNVNLLIGIILAIVGLGVLIHLALEKPETPWDMQKYLVLKIPRFGLALAIEILAFFFLNLYKVSGLEVRYFANELSTYESKALALQMGKHERPEMMSEAIRALALNERNFILNKGETAIPIETEKPHEDLPALIGRIIDKLIESKLLKTSE